MPSSTTAARPSPLPPWVYPALLVGHLALYLALVRAHAPPFIAYALVATLLFVLLLGLERVRPYCAAWQRDDAQRPHDVLHLVVGSTLGGAVGRSLADALVIGLAGWAGADERLAHWPIALRFALGFLLAEASRFAWHYGQHHVGALWRLHRLHHDATVVCALKSGRAHIASYALQALATSLPILGLGLGVDALAASVCAQGLVGILAHANVDFDERWIASVLQSPSVHRLHHRRIADRREKTNLAATLNLFDQLAKTFVHPRAVGARTIAHACTDDAPYAVGVTGPSARSIVAQLLLTDEPAREAPRAHSERVQGA